MRFHRVRRRWLAWCMLPALCAAPVAADQIVRIGFASPLSGPQVHYGRDNENGCKMAVDDLNGKRMVINGQRVQFQLVVEDDQADPLMGPRVARHLVDAGVKAVIGHFNSGVSIPASRIYGEAGIPQLSVSTALPYTRQGLKTAFRLVGSDGQVGSALGLFAVRTLKATRIVAIDDHTAYGHGIADEFVRAVQANGGNVARRALSSDKTTDFSAILAVVKPLNPDVIFYGGADAQAAPMLRQMRRKGIHARLMGGDMLNTPKFIELAGPDADGTVSAFPGGELGDRQAGRRFEQRYRARFGREVERLGPQFYDGVMLVAEAMRRAGSTEPSRYLPALATIRYSGVTADFAFNAHGDLLDAPVTLAEVRHGRWVSRATVR